MSPHLHLLLLLASPLLCAPSISKSYHQQSDLHNNVSQRAATCAGTWPPPATSCATAAPGTTPASTSRQGTSTAASRPPQTGHRRWADTMQCGPHSGISNLLCLEVCEWKLGHVWAHCLQDWDTHQDVGGVQWEVLQ